MTSSKRKSLILAAALAIVMIAAVGVTWAAFNNTYPENDDNFTVSINGMEESYTVLPGKTETINAKVVANNSATPAYLFVWVTTPQVNGTNVVGKLTWADNWTLLTGLSEGSNVVYYCEISGETNQSFDVLTDITYNTALTNEDIAKISSDPNCQLKINSLIVQKPGFDNALAAYTGNYNSSTPNTFTHSDNFANVDSYLYRVGNGNAVKLGSLFKSNSDDDADVASDDVIITVTKVDNNTSVSETVTYTKNDTDWTQSTLQFSGEGPVKVTIQEGDTGEQYTLNLEIVTANNFAQGSTLNSNANIVLLGDVSLGASSDQNPALTLNGKNLYGNGFSIDATGSNISTKGHGIISLSNSTMDNVVVNGPVFNDYVGSYNKDHFSCTVLCNDGAVITNSRITNASSPLNIRGNAVVRDTILSGGIKSNCEIRTGTLTIENVTTINTQNSLGILFMAEAPTETKLIINGYLTQHNFVSENAQMSNSNANTLKDTMFGSTYSKYQFTDNGTKYMNTGIVSMSAQIGAENIVDNRSDKKNYSGMTATLAGINGYVYTMENTDSSMLETSYTEPGYTASTQIPYAPVFTWAVPDADYVPAGGDEHCYRDSSGILQIQFMTDSSKTLNISSLPTIMKYQQKIIPNSVVCTKDASGINLTLTDGNVTFTEVGTYTLTYTYTDDEIYNQNVSTTGSVTYTAVIRVNVAVKKNAPNAVIECTSNSGTMIWGTAGNIFDKDYRPAAQIFDDMTITDYDDNGNSYTVLDGNQVTFMSKIASIDLDADQKTGFTINFPDGTKLHVSCSEPYLNGTLMFQQYNNKFLMCGTGVYNNKGDASWYVYSYTYTGRNGVAVTYDQKRTFSATGSTSNYSLSDLSTNKFLMYDAQGGSVSPTYASSSPATLPTPTRDGYTFLNWNTKADGTGTSSNAGASYSFSSTTTLYAIWAKNISVSFNSNGSIVATVSGGPGTSNTLPAVTDTDEWLVGWYDAETDGNRIGGAGESFTIPNSDTRYYAHWSPKYTVTFVANGGTVSPESAIYEGTAVTLPTPTNGSMSFKGWYTEANGGELIGGAGDSYTPTEKTILYAQWQKLNTFTTKFENAEKADGYLYRVGNGNAVALGSLFKLDTFGDDSVESSNVKITVVSVNNNASVTGSEDNSNLETDSTAKCVYSKASDWTLSTLKFSGEGPVRVTIKEGDNGIPYTLNLEVVNAMNTTTGNIRNSGISGGTNFVFLNDVEYTEGQTIEMNGSTIYGNGFKWDFSEWNPNDNALKNVFVLKMNNGTLDNVRMIGKTYTDGAYVYKSDSTSDNKPENYMSLVVASGESKILNSYVSGTRSPVRVEGNLTISNSTIAGGNVANIDVKSGTLNLNNVTTINQGTKPVGYGIFIDNDATDVTINVNGLNSYNWLTKDDKDNMVDNTSNKYMPTILQSVFDDSNFNGVTAINFGIICLNNSSGVTVTGANALTRKEATISGSNGVLWYATGDSVASAPGDNNPNKYDPILPEYTWSNQLSDGRYITSFEEGGSATLPDKLLTATKYGIPLDIQTSGTTTYSGLSVGTHYYTITYTITDPYVYDKDGNQLDAVTYTKTMEVIVTVTEKLVSAPVFTFKGKDNSTSYTGIVVESPENPNIAYVTPSVTSDTTGFKKIKTVNGSDIYAPIVEVRDIVAYSGSDQGYRRFCAIFEGVSVSQDGNVIANSSTKGTALPEGFTWITDTTNLYLDIGAGWDSYTTTGSSWTIESDYKGLMRMSNYISKSTFSNHISGTTIKTYTIEFTYSGDDGKEYHYYICYQGDSDTETGQYNKYSSCFASGTLITLADGTQKAIENITPQDCVLAWDFVNGEYVAEEVFTIANHGEDIYDLVELGFDDGTKLEIIKNHGLFDLTEMSFVNITVDNAAEYIGHSFVKRDDKGRNTSAILTSAVREKRQTTSYSIISKHQLDVLANGILTTDPLTCFLFPFAVTDALVYDEALMQQDIETYGLLSYEAFREYAPHMTETQFYAGNGQYIPIALGKGIITMDEIVEFAKSLLIDQQYLTN